MRVGKNISTLLSIAAFLMAVIIAPASNAAASHACCPPEMAASMKTGQHMMAQHMNMAAQMAGEEAPMPERACDFTCCGLATSIAVAADGADALNTHAFADTAPITSQSQMVSVPHGVQSPPPKFL